MATSVAWKTSSVICDSIDSRYSHTIVNDPAKKRVFTLAISIDDQMRYYRAVIELKSLLNLVPELSENDELTTSWSVAI